MTPSSASTRTKLDPPPSSSAGPPRRIVLASVPIHGHVMPLLAVARGLAERGHTVRFLTGARFEAAVRETGAQFVALPAGADYDDRTLQRSGPGRRSRGPSSLRHDVRRLFLAPGLRQYEALLDLLEAGQPPDAVIVDPTFVGGVLLAGHPRARRPAVIGAGVLPLGLDSRDVAPYGLGLPPADDALSRLRLRLLRLLAGRLLFAGVQRDFDLVYSAVHTRPSPVSVFSAMAGLDAVVQFSVPSLEYPRPDAPVPLHFAGPVASSADAATPPWWPDLQSPRRVVVLTQGTLANRDFHALVHPTLTALADREDLLVVLTTGGPGAGELTALPGNARVADYLPYDRLMPLADVLVTNGGFGGVHFALAHGVPVIVAGDSEDKPEVAARVAWAGVGLDLRTGRPSPTQVRGAVDQVLADPRFARRAHQVAGEIAACDPIGTLLKVLDEVGAPGRLGTPVG